MGDRVAVMRKGELQQVADPQTLYDRPVNLFVGGFIGSPSMNMLEATARAVERHGRRRDSAIAARSRSTTEIADARPALECIRRQRRDPRHPARGPRGRGARRRRAGRPASAREPSSCAEALGSEIMVHFRVDAHGRADTEEYAELAEDMHGGDRAAGSGNDEGGEAIIVGRFGARSRVTEGETVEVGRRHAHAALLRPETGLGIYDDRPEEQE